MGDGALAEVEDFVDVDFGFGTASDTTLDFFEFLHHRDHFLCQGPLHLSLRYQVTLICDQHNRQVDAHGAEEGEPEKGYSGGGVGI